MAKGYPLASPITGARYLPTYDRQVVGAHGRTAPNTSGFDFERRMVDNFWDGVTQFTKARTHAAATYYEICKQRDARDTETLIENTIRQRKADIFSTKLGRDADNLIEEENEWQLKTRDEIIKQSGLSKNLASALWDDKAQAYLNRVGAFMLEQNRVAEQNSKFAAATSALDTLSLSKIGDFQAFAQFIARTKNVYRGEDANQIKFFEKGMDTLIDSWVAQNPQKALSWYNENKEKLRLVGARLFPNADAAMQRAESRLHTQYNLALAQEARQQRWEDYQQKKVDKGFESEATRLILSDDQVDIKNVIKQGLDQGVSGGSIYKVQKIFEQVAKGVTAKASLETFIQFLTKASTTGLSDEDESTIATFLSTGQLTPAHYRTLMTASRQSHQFDKSGLKESWSLAVKTLRNAIAPRGPFEKPDQAREDICLRAINELYRFVHGCKNVNEQMRALDYNVRDSFVSQLIEKLAVGQSALDRDTLTPKLDQAYTPHYPEGLEELESAYGTDAGVGEFSGGEE